MGGCGAYGGVLLGQCRRSARGGCSSYELRRVSHGGSRGAEGFTSVFFYFVGQYLGAGKLVTVAPESEGSVYKMIKIRCPYSMQDHARRFLDMFGIKYTIMNERSSCEFIISAAVLYDWLSKYFGDDATTKTLPTFVFGIPERRRRALLEGYVDARRPYYEPSRWRIAVMSCLPPHRRNLPSA